TIADFGHATLNIGGGGLVSAGTTIIARSTGSVGILDITGAGSNATFSTLILGSFGNATLNVSGGGVLNPGTIAGIGVGTNSVATANISGPGSSVSCGSLFVGVNGRGTLTVSDGGHLTSIGNAELASGFAATRFAQVTVSGPGSSWINSGAIDMDSL